MTEEMQGLEKAEAREKTNEVLRQYLSQPSELQQLLPLLNLLLDLEFPESELTLVRAESAKFTSTLCADTKIEIESR
jgi:hypothetical protein